MNKIWLGLAGAALCAPVMAQTAATLIPVTTRGDGVFEARALSPDGSTIAGVVPGNEPTFPGYTACRWTLAAGLRVIPRSNVQPTWEPADFPLALSRDGSIIGLTVGSRQHMAARWSLEFGFQVAPQLDAGNQQTNGFAMSYDGRYIVGEGSNNSGWRAFLADVANLTNINLLNVGSPTSVFYARAYAIDGAGDKVIGTYQPTGTNQTVYCLWENASTRTTLTCPPQFAQWFINRISGDGATFFGGAALGAQPNVFLPVRWSPQAGAALLPVPAGVTDANVQYVNASGDTLAGIGRINGVQQAMIWLPDGTVVAIDAYCDAHGLAHPGMHFDDVGGLSADGKVALVTGLRGDTREGWMLRLPGAVSFCASDIGSPGGTLGPDGQLDNNDFITFIAYFFARNARADVGTIGGLRGSDFLLDNNDFIVFINEFFQGCE